MNVTFRAALLVLSGIAAIVTAISFMPPLTQGGNTALPGVSAEALELAIGTERAFCQESGQGLDCECFAGKAGVVMAAREPQIPSAVYANRQELARSQATSSC